MQFDFIGMQRIYLSMAREDAGPLADALRERPSLDVTSQWANFVRNHDEADPRTSPPISERKEVFAAFGSDPRHALFTGACAADCRRCSAATTGASASSTR